MWCAWCAQRVQLGIVTPGGVIYDWKIYTPSEFWMPVHSTRHDAPAHQREARADREVDGRLAAAAREWQWAGASMTQLSYAPVHPKEDRRHA